MAYAQSGYPGMYPPQDPRYGAHPYYNQSSAVTANLSTAMSAPAIAPHPGGHMMAGSAASAPDYGHVQGYPRQTYADAPSAFGFDHAMWQPPQAPRLSAAAARAGRAQSLGYGVYGYAPNRLQTPWQHSQYGTWTQSHGSVHPYPQGSHHLPLNRPPQHHQQQSLLQPAHQHHTYQQQPRTHQQLEHQLLMQHQIAKAHERQLHTAPFLTYQSGTQTHQHKRQPSSSTSGGAPEWQHSQQSSYASDFPRSRTDSHREASHREAWSRYGSTGDVDDVGRDWNATGGDWHNWQSGNTGSALPLPAGFIQQNGHARQSRATFGCVTTPSAAWTGGERFAVPSQGHADPWRQPGMAHDLRAQDVGPAQYGAQASALVPQASDRQQWAVPSQSFATAPQAVHAHSDEHTRELRYRVDSDLWQPRPETQLPEMHHDNTDAPGSAAAVLHEKGEDTAAANASTDQEQAPAPPSPETLDKSGVPIAAIGAQLIWNACTALFDSDLLAEAHSLGEDQVQVAGEEDDDADERMSHTPGSNASSSSTPSLSTPDVSPWASTVLDDGSSDSIDGDWNAFRSPFGPERTKNARGHASSFTLGNDGAFHHDLHRMAVGAERNRARSGQGHAQNRTRQSSAGNSELATGHSSGASTASSSEPGTPSSLPRASPDGSSTMSARSANPIASPAHSTSRMSVDRVLSDPQPRSRRHPSRASSMTAGSRWSGRIRDNIVAVLRLVSPEWRWSNNDHKLVSLAETLPVSLSATSTASHVNAGHTRSAAGKQQGRDSVVGIVTSYANEPSPAFRRFAHQVLAQTLLSPTAFLLGILNALRLPLMARLSDGSMDPAVLDLFAQPTSAAPFKLFTVGMMIANKHLDDNTFLNKTWTEVTGIPLTELNQIEAWYLKKCNYDVTVPEETWVGFLNRLQSWEEKRSSHGVHRDQDGSKRLLIVLDEALSHFDAIPGFNLDTYAQGGRTELAGHTLADEAMEALAPPARSDFGYRSDEGADATLTDIWSRGARPARPADLFGVHHQHCRSAPSVATLMGQCSSHAGCDERRSSFERRPTLSMTQSTSSGIAADAAASLLRTRSECANSSSSKTISPASESGKTQCGTMTGPLIPSTLLNSTRAALLHSTAFAPLSTSGWTHI
ncbi:hypothetical protein BCV70DRAFT_218265 [Testicularia cyperi]|uniref:Cyclin N-terminal domain-containing protein n=1 Tax=Testicularia cyperi TaxID=1882483 RepID=A0A317XKA5_9BASI|nr:hypothetical protein BCV70DRAFT_218265 [Testicularia cyperi]